MRERTVLSLRETLRLPVQLILKLSFILEENFAVMKCELFLTTDYLVTKKT